MARFITGLRVVGAVLAGGSGMPWPSFIFYNACGAIVWCTVVGIVGYTLGHSWELLEKWVGRTSLIALAGFAVLVAIMGLDCASARSARPRESRHPRAQ